MRACVRACVRVCVCLSTITCADRAAPNFRHFDDVIFNLRIHSQQFFFFFYQLLLVFFFFLFFFLLLLLSVFLHLKKTIFCRKRFVFPCFLVYRRIGEYISLDLFYLQTVVLRLHA